jgi:phosphate transport system permease protein
LFAPGNSIASALASEFTEAVTDMHTSALMALGLVLFMITMVVLAGAKLLLMSLEQDHGGRT